MFEGAVDVISIAVRIGVALAAANAAAAADRRSSPYLRLACA